VRCFVSQPGTGNQGLAEAGRPNASRSKGFEPKTLVEKRKRAAGIEPASSAWKAEVLPLNYARGSTEVLELVRRNRLQHYDLHRPPKAGSPTPDDPPQERLQV
jgi:hypothetical protein